MKAFGFCFCLIIGLFNRCSSQITHTLKNDINPLRRYDRCAGKHQVMLPVAGSCAEFDFCINGVATRSSCGPLHHFNALKSVCDTPANAACFVNGDDDNNTDDGPNGIDIEICQNYANNGKLFPVPDSCSHYFICFRKQIFVRSCGNFYFDPELAACVSGECPQQNSTPNICYGKRNGATIPIPDNCSQFIYCENDKAIRKSCGAMHFSPTKLTCQEPHLAGCETKTFCYGRISGTKFEHPTDVNKYILCRDNQEIEMKCPTGSYFNPTRNECFRRLGVNLVDGFFKNSDLCTNIGTGQLLRNPLDCGKFYMCSNGASVEMSCPWGLHFNVRTNHCDYPDVANCDLME